MKTLLNIKTVLFLSFILVSQTSCGGETKEAGNETVSQEVEQTASVAQPAQEKVSQDVPKAPASKEEARKQIKSKVNNDLNYAKKNAKKFGLDGSEQPKGTEVVKINTAEFKQWVFDFEKNQEWKFEGDLPVIVDFYADWCRPCKIIAPILEELQQEYKGKIQVYKVNVDHEPELSRAFQTTSIPALLFIPKEGQPQMAKGALPKETFVKAINEVLKVK